MPHTLTPHAPTATLTLRPPHSAPTSGSRAPHLSSTPVALRVPLSAPLAADSPARAAHRATEEPEQPNSPRHPPARPFTIILPHRGVGGRPSRRAAPAGLTAAASSTPVGKQSPAAKEKGWGLYPCTPRSGSKRLSFPPPPLRAAWISRARRARNAARGPSPACGASRISRQAPGPSRASQPSNCRALSESDAKTGGRRPGGTPWVGLPWAAHIG